MTGSLERQLTAGLLVLCMGTSAAGQTIYHADASSGDKLHSKFGLAIEDNGASLRAEMMLLGESGQARVLPRLSSAWSPHANFGIDTVLQYGDSSPTGSALQPNLESKLSLRPDVSYLDTIEGSIRRTGDTTTESLQLKFTQLDTGWRILGGDPLTLGTNLRMRAQDSAPELASQLTSALGVGTGLRLLTGLQLHDSDAAIPDASAVDARLIYRSPIPFIKQLEGDLRHPAVGDLRQSLAVHFPDLEHGALLGTSFKLSSAATLVELTRPDGLETRLLGLETKFSGARLPLVGGSNALTVRLERSFEAQQPENSSLAYDHAWSPREQSSIGFKLRLLRSLEQTNAAMDVRWNARF